MASRDRASRLSPPLLNETPRPRLLRWPGVGLVAAVFFIGLALRLGAGDGFHYLKGIRVGAEYAQPQELLPGQVAGPGRGYDGQMYFYIAQDPFLTRPATARSLDSSFRYRRILYPLLAWALSLGRRALVPFTLVAINVIACTALITLLAREAERRGRSPWSALCVAVFSGVWIPLLLDLTEPLQLALLALGAIGGSATVLLLSALAKETSAVALVAAAARAAWDRSWAMAARHAALLAAFLVWSAAVQIFVTGPGFRIAAPQILAPPGAPFVALAQDAAHSPASLLIAAPAVAICVIALLRTIRNRDAVALAAGLYALVALAANLETWLDPTGFLRIMAGAVVLCFISWARSGDRAGLAVNILAAGSGLLALPPLLLAR